MYYILLILKRRKGKEEKDGCTDEYWQFWRTAAH